jgi:aryl-alcohol dehydrogenase-like predicted oxidoreductase
LGRFCSEAIGIVPAKDKERVSIMEYRQLGSSGLRVSALTMGTMTFGASGPFAPVGSIDADEARRWLGLCLDAGVNVVDTGDIYSGGATEEMLGAIMGKQRAQLVLATKGGRRTSDNPNSVGNSRQHIIAACEASLRRLNTDYIDLYQLHGWDGQTRVEETLEALEHLIRSGKVRYVGCSNFSGWHVMKTLAVAKEHGLPRFVSHQIYYSLLGREAEYELVPIAIDQGLGLLVWSPLAGGFLTGKYRRGENSPKETRHVSGWREPPVNDWDRLYDVVEVLIDIAHQRNATPSQVALAYLLSKPGVSSLVIGARTEQQLVDNLQSVELDLDEQEFVRLEHASSLTAIYPYWHQAKAISDRLGPADLALLAQFL